MSAPSTLRPFVSVEEYLAGEARDDIRHEYQTLSRLEAYLPVEQDARRVEYIEQGNIPLDCLDESLAVADIYTDIR